MTQAILIDGKAQARVLRDGLKTRVEKLRQKNIIPRLEVVLIGDHPSSLIYVGTKQRAAGETGIDCTIHHLPATISQDDVLAKIRALNRPEIHGILLQLPLPAHLDTTTVLNAIDYSRDVDGLTIENVRRRTAHEPGLLPCTPKGCIKLIKSVEPNIAGKKAVVVGRSNLVGKPMAELLQREGCDVETINRVTPHPQAIARQADILVVAIGAAKHITKNWVMPGAIVIDVGINRVDNKICGDVDFDNVKEVARAITPVPGGVGPMTVACLLENVVEVAESF
jgi:methylenetetrahydrofolate dehydrogenase (NADP+)/methenyltetrahydrofolate cyclohydrolase